MANASQQELLRSLPQVEEVLQDPAIAVLQETLPRALVTDCVRDVIDATRKRVLSGAEASVDFDLIVAGVHRAALHLQKPSLRRVINASGVIVHTNLGRSVLAPQAVEAVVDVARNYSTLEYDVAARERGSRHDHCEQLICSLTGAEAAIAVNNNAAAVMMVLSEFAAEHEAIVSRGELVEIGGSFRVPDIMGFSHARMVEVGTTNKTYLSDYANAITPDTALLLKVHPSNYRMVGFTESVSVKELKRLADDENTQRAEGVHDLLVYEDQGSGVFIRLDSFGEYAEPTVAESLQQGCDLVSFSGDKLLGGPQAGIIVGKNHLIDRLKKNPLARVLRLDKMTLAALEATLRLYFDPDEACRAIPTLSMLSVAAEEVRTRAEDLKACLEKVVSLDQATMSIESEISRAGGGALPMCDIDTYVVSLDFKQGSAQACENYLISENSTPIIARIKNDALLFDARTLLNEQEYNEIAEALTSYFEGVK